jgi:Holliday junction resolvase RusA-like endonuclease
MGIFPKRDGAQMISINGEIHSSKNSRQIWRKNDAKHTPFIAKSARSKEDEMAIYLQLCEQRPKWWAELQGAKYPLRIAFQFRRKTHGRFDYLNIAQGVADAMVKAEYIPDDSADYFIPIFVPYVVDKYNPGCDFWIAE